MLIQYTPIGLIHSPFKQVEGTPIQSLSVKDVEGYVEVFPEYIAGLEDLEDFSHIYLIYHFHLIKEGSLRVKPYMDTHFHGVFATRAPRRPNPIGISVVRIISIENNILRIRGVDVIDGTPLLDIKPYVPDFDITDVDKIGWLKQNIDKLPKMKDDGRFIK